MKSLFPLILGLFLFMVIFYNLSLFSQINSKVFSIEQVASFASVPAPCDQCVIKDSGGIELFSCKDQDGSTCSYPAAGGQTITCNNAVKCEDA